MKGTTPNIPTPDYTPSMKTKKCHIGIEKNLKMPSVADYWDEETVSQVVDLLIEYEYIFPSTFS